MPAFFKTFALFAVVGFLVSFGLSFKAKAAINPEAATRNIGISTPALAHSGPRIQRPPVDQDRPQAPADNARTN